MIAPKELLEIKSRLLRAADAARSIADSADPVFYDEEAYALVHESLTSLKGDISRVLAELDVLRGMFATNLTNFFMEGVGNGVGVSDGRGAVAPVQEQQGGPSGEAVGEVASGAGVGVQESRPPRKRRSRSKPRGHSQGDSEVSTGVGSGDGAGEVDSSSPS